ncbi:hypothetical protein [Streptomyces sp. SID2999]|uniref:hypothetical protein n=1 Tax=Streptomyces sp. SID2999 TaxID=2690258 RepID=UPI001F2BD0DE|nr:hypothetical protein [Streptomyces sp. SID2999]
MAELSFSADDLAQVRFAVSPMWEVAPSFRLLASDAAHPIHRPWIEQARPHVLAAGLHRGWLAELIGPSGYVPARTAAAETLLDAASLTGSASRPE